MTDFRIALWENPPESWIATTHDGVDLFNIADTGISESYPVHVFVEGEDNSCVGGLIGSIWGGWLHVISLWVDEAFRGEGYGTGMLKEAEAYALSKGCIGATLDTHNARAKGLYEKLGYETFGKIDDFPPGQAQYFLAKRFPEATVNHS